MPHNNQYRKYKVTVEHASTGTRKDVELVSVDESDVDWRTPDDWSELSYDWNVVKQTFIGWHYGPDPIEQQENESEQLVPKKQPTAERLVNVLISYRRIRGLSLVALVLICIAWQPYVLTPYYTAGAHVFFGMGWGISFASWVVFTTIVRQLENCIDVEETN